MLPVGKDKADELLLSRYPHFRKKLDGVKSLLGNTEYEKFDKYFRSLPDNVLKKLDAEPELIEDFAKRSLKDPEFAEKVRKGDVEEIEKLKKVDKFDNWNSISAKVDELLSDKAKQIKKLYPDAEVGYRGSIATGKKFNPPGSFDPKDFDVDAFIVSDELAKKIGNKAFRNARVDGSIDKITNELENAFKQNFPGYRSEPGKPFTLRVWTKSEFESKVKPYGFKII